MWGFGLGGRNGWYGQNVAKKIQADALVELEWDEESDEDLGGTWWTGRGSGGVAGAVGEADSPQDHSTALSSTLRQVLHTDAPL